MRRPHTHDEYRSSRAWIIVECALEYFVSILISGAYLARITSGLGFSDGLTGILTSFASLGCLFQLGAVFLFNNMRSAKKPVMLCHLFTELMFVLVYLAPVVKLSPGQKTALFVFAYCAAQVLQNLLRANKTEWTLSLIDDRSRGIFTAKNEMVSLLGGMVFTYIMGSIIDHMEAAGDPQKAYIVGAVTLLILMAAHMFSIFSIREKPAAVSENTGIRESLRHLLGDANIRKIVLIHVLWRIADSSAYPFYGAYQIKELGFSMTFVSVLSIIYSIVRVSVSPLIGRYADKHSFVKMSHLCFSIAGLGYLINCFTVPANGRIVYTAYFCLYAVAMGGINSSVNNLIFENVKGEHRRNALALNAALGGLAGFGATCIMSPIVTMIQNNGNRLFGIPLYAAQFVSIVAFVMTVVLVVYMRVCIIGKKEK